MPDDARSAINAKLNAAKKAPGKSHSKVLLSIIKTATLFHAPDDTPYAAIPVNGHFENWEVKSKAFKHWLTHHFYRETAGAPSADALKQALGVAEAQACFDGPEVEVYRRVAHVDGKTWLDLCDKDWRALEIDASGWRVVERPAVRFRRMPSMQPLPTPEPGGKVELLRPFLNVDDNQFILTVGFIAGTLSAGPYTILNVCGEQGSTKSTLVKIVRSVIDPDEPALQGPPRSDQDLYISAHNRHIVALDNISHIPEWIADTLCRIATGGGFITRLLYEDAEEMRFKGLRPVILNSIGNHVLRSDLADRSIGLLLKNVSDKARRTEKAVLAAFNNAHPKILGAILDGAVRALRKPVELESLPRMADFMQWVASCEGAWWEEGTFERAYRENRETAQLDIMEANQFGAALLKLIDHTPPSQEVIFEGQPSKLLAELESLVDDHLDRRNWPTQRSFINRLREVAPALRLNKVLFQELKRSHGLNKIALLRQADQHKLDLEEGGT